MKKFEINIYENIIHLKKYKKILNISDCNIKIDIFDKIVNINGKCLRIVGIDEYEICIKGEILSIEFING